jgi:FkbM family methyltransferase
MPRSLAAYRYYTTSIATLITRFHQPLGMVRRFLGPSRFTPDRVTIRSSGLTFIVRSKMDIWSVKESAVDRLYEEFGFPLGSDWSVIDIGAAIGEFAIHAAHDPSNSVTAFEPFPESFELLQKNIALNNLTNVTATPRAVSSVTGELLLETTGGEPLMMDTASTAKPDRDQIPVESISLNDVIASRGGDRVDLLKLDCEGAEYDILLNAAPETLAQIDRIVMEYHDTIDHQHPALVTFLTRAGYVVDTFPNVVHPDRIGYLRAIRSTAGSPGQAR